MNDNTFSRSAIGIIAVGSLIGLCIALMFREPPAGSKEVLLIVVGALVAICTDVKQYFFGTTSSATQVLSNQTDTVNKLTTAVANSAPVQGADTIKPAGTKDDPVNVTEVADPTAEEPKAAFASVPTLTDVVKKKDPVEQAAMALLVSLQQKRKARIPLPKDQIDVDPTKAA